MDDYKFTPISEVRVIGRFEDMPIARFHRLYWFMLQPWFPWRLRKWIERAFISRWNAKKFRVEHVDHRGPRKTDEVK